MPKFERSLKTKGNTFTGKHGLMSVCRVWRIDKLRGDPLFNKSPRGPYNWYTMYQLTLSANRTDGLGFNFKMLFHNLRGRVI